MRMMQKNAVWILSALLCACLGAMAGGLPKELPDPDGKPANMKKPVQVFILMGQSNMLGFGKLSGLKTATGKGLYPYLVDADGNWTVRKDVRNVRLIWSRSKSTRTLLNDWMSPATGIGGSKQIGPEIGIGYHVGEVLDAPVLILKACIGNRSLGIDLLPPSAKGYQGDPKLGPRRTKPFDPNKWYAGIQYDGDVGSALKILKDIGTYYPGATKYEVAGFCFWQGAKDCGRGGNADNYESNLVELIKSLRKDFDAPNAPFVCATMGNGKKGGGGAAGKITDAQLAVDGRTGKYPEFKNTVRTFYSNPVSKGGSANSHYSGNAETYMNVGEGMGRLMAELLVANAAVKQPKAGNGSRPRAARELPAEKFKALQLALQKSLAELSANGKLKKIKIKMKGTKREVYLKAADEEGNLTYRMLNSQRTARFQLQKLSAWDHAYLATLVTKMKPKSSDAKAMTGVFFENAGSTKMADEFYEKAGESSTRKLEKLFQ